MEDVRSPVEIYELVPPIQISLCARHIPVCLNVIADSLPRSTHPQSTNWSLHPELLNKICKKWFTPHMDLFDTRLNHKVPLYPQLKTVWGMDVLNMNWLGQ